jgi:asparagine synthase (glutamine-hydrolysing)
MCGIYGALAPHPVQVERCREQIRRMAHRGPDDAGCWVSPEGRVVLGHRRLSILDLSQAGHQPMASPCGRFHVVFNGEIYNYLEIREELLALGYTFSGSGDTEVVLAAYRQWGAECLARFNGMFALGIWDAGSTAHPPCLFLARDRAGKKPLYYTQQGKSFSFASELKSLGAGGGVDLRALNFYLALGYVPGELCLTEGVRKLPPAHAAMFFPDTGELRCWRYWSLPENRATALEDCEALADRAEALLRDAVKLRLRSDVPVGVLLSGGLDSSLVVAAAAQASARPIKTFTISFPGTRYDEAGYAALVARHFATEHHVLEVPQPSLGTLEEFAPFIDEPLADSSLLPSYLVSKLTVQQVKVALGGDGGDELFGGYSDYTTALADLSRLGWLPGALLQAAASVAGRLPAGVRGRNRLFALQGGPCQSLIWGSPYFDYALRRRILGPDQLRCLGEELDEPERWLLSLFNQGSDPVDCMTRTHFGSILPDDFLVKVDRSSMAVSLELRAPLLDYRLVEFAFSSIPSVWKVRGTESRRLQKMLGRRMLPRQLDIDRKQGFSIPLDSWLRASNGSEIQDLRGLLPDAIAQDEVGSLIAGHLKGRANGARLFALMMLALSQKNIRGGSFA